MNLMKLMTPNSTIQLNKQRIEKHMTIKPVASIIGVSVDTIMRIEQNKYSLHNADKFRKIRYMLYFRLRRTKNLLTLSAVPAEQPR